MTTCSKEKNVDFKYFWNLIMDHFIGLPPVE